MVRTRDLLERVLRSAHGRVVRSAHGRVVPLADARTFDPAARRTRLVRLLLAAALIGATVAAFFVAPSSAGRTFLPPNAVGIVVLDVSSSVKPDTYFRIEQSLAAITASHTRLGLVLFSDVAYEALPPGTPSDQLRPYLRFFAPANSPLADRSDDSDVARSPWEQWFSAGTRISGGLYLAAHMLQKENVTRGAVILISDLADDPVDISRLTASIAYLDEQRMPLEIVGLNPTPQNLDYFRTLLGDEALFKTARLPTAAEAAGKVSLGGSFSTALLAVAAIALALLTLNEWWAEPLRWRRAAA
jgi:hypothetical protein